MHVGHPYIPLFKIRRIFDLLVYIYILRGPLGGYAMMIMCRLHGDLSCGEVTQLDVAAHTMAELAATSIEAEGPQLPSEQYCMLL